MKPISSSERKGILVVALVAMVITSAGYFISRCERASTASAPSAPPSGGSASDPRFLPPQKGEADEGEEIPTGFRPQKAQEEGHKPEDVAYAKPARRAYSAIIF